MEATSRKRPSSTRARRRTLTFYAFLTPFLLGLVFLTFTPFVVGFLTSLTNFDGLNLYTGLRFVGLVNYGRAFTDPYVSFSLGRTLAWTSLNLPLWMGLSLLLALILNQDVKGRSVFRTLYYLPSVVPAAAAVTAWKMLLDQNNGLLNAIIGIWKPGTAISWLGTYSLQGLTMIALWTGLGSGMLIFLAGLQGIPDELVEAAKIDGANSWQTTRYVTFPLMTPVIFFVLIQALIGSFQQLVFPLLFGTNRGIQLYMIYTYQQVFSNQRYGYGTALLWLLFIGVTILSLLVFWSQKYWVYQGDAAPTGESR